MKPTAEKIDRARETVRERERERGRDRVQKKGGGKRIIIVRKSL